MVDFFIGVDGGGTSCRAVVATSDGQIIGYGKSGSANIVTDSALALRSVMDAVAQAFAAAGLDHNQYENSHAVLGLAGGNVEDAGAPIARQLPFAHSDVEFDGLIALQGALGDTDGAVAILGTGTAYIIRQRGQVYSLGGWGFPISDLGSGARIGQSALQECLLAYDGIHPSTALSTALLDKFDNRPDNLVEFARDASPGDFGEYAPMVFRFADEGDAAALRLLANAASYVSETLDVLIAKGCKRISLLGGMAPLYKRWLPQHQQALAVEPAADALTGALQLARKRYGNAIALHERAAT